MAKVVVVGATSGIGRELATLFSRQGHVVGIVGRSLARRSHAYVTKRWRLVAWLLKSLPDSLYHRI